MSGDASVRTLQDRIQELQVRQPVARLVEEAQALELASYEDLDGLRLMLAEWHQGQVDLIDIYMQHQVRILNLLEQSDLEE